ncbi:MAG: calcium/sodium antiporter [Clostridia bacterium]|nr:calcium/sodium antiporter [Clostridia bacterium]
MESVIMYALFAVGILFIVKGGDWFVDGAAWVAEVTGIPKFIVGATIVSVATTLPEIFVSSIAAVEGHGILMSGVGDFIFQAEEKVGLAIGNGIGSVICNTAMIMALSLVFMPPEIERRKFSPKALHLGLALVLLMIVTRTGSLSTRASIVLLVIFVSFIIENVKSSRSDSLDYDEPPQVDKKAITRNVLEIIVGAAGIVIGSRLLVDYGSDIARSWGVSESIIGVTMVAIGTSLPELVTAVSAIIKKEPSMSVGNVIGANVIDIVLILPICSLIYGGNLPISQQNIYLDFPVSIIVSAIAFIPTIIAKKFSRWQGIVLLLIYAVYLIIVSSQPDWYISLFN